MASRRCLGEMFSDFAATLKKGVHIQVEGPLRSREYEKDGVTHRSFECKAESTLKLDRAARQEAPESAGKDPSTEDVSF